jgi:DNA-binding response OmpR family regulator
MTGAKLLIVDDEEMIADTLSMIFRRLGYEAFTAYNGLLGLDAARDLKPNLVLSDVAMPELDGVNMAMRICNALPEVEVLLFSGQAGTMDLLHDAEEHGYHFELLQKPVPPDEIVRKVAAMLANPCHSCHRTVTPPTIDSSPNLP